MRPFLPHAGDAPAWSRGLCNRHYKQGRAPLQPRCDVAGCGRRSNAYGRCVLHRYDGRRAIKPVRKPAGRVLGWGRLSITGDAARAVEQEAKRRGTTPSALMAEIVEAWAGGPSGTTTRAVRRVVPRAKPRP